MLLLCHFTLCAGQKDILIYDSMYGPIQLSLHENVKFAISQALLHQPTNKEMKSSPSLLIAEITYKVCHITRLFSMPFYPAYGGLQKSHIKVCHITRLFSMSFYPTYGGLVETISCSRCEMPTDKSYTGYIQIQYA